MTLKEIREAYDQNYHEMLKVIYAMGGDDQIRKHRHLKTPLYQRLRMLQRREHQLANLEDRLRNRFSVLHS